MSLETIIAKIESESQEESQAILKKAQVQADEHLAQARKEAESAQKLALEKGEQEAKRLAQRLLQTAELKARKELLQLRQELLEEVFNSALNKLKELPADKYQVLIRRMLLSQELTGDEQIVVANEDKKVLGNGFMAEVNQELKKRGLTADIELVFDEQLSRGGFILRHGMVENNNSFTGLLRAQRDELELTVAQALFGE